MTQKKQPRIGIQGPVVSWHDPWAGEASDTIMRTGTGSVCPSQDPTPDPKEFVRLLKEMGADFYVHHVIPGMDADQAMLKDAAEAGLDVVLGNEYGNINGPFVEGTNRYDVPDQAVIDAARSGSCIGLLYDEPEHLQINVGQYRKDGWFPHFANTDGLSLEQARDKVEASIRQRVEHVKQALSSAGIASSSVPLISEHVFPTMFHTFARAGMDVAPKTMKESLQSLQLSTALGAAKQYNRNLWICADLWGPDAGEWFTRFHGFPGHTTEEYASALRMSYYMAPTYLFTENIDPLVRNTASGFKATEFGDVWNEFTRKFIPENPLTWHHSEADPDIVIIHSDDSNYGQNERLFGNRSQVEIQGSQSVFHIWHVLSGGSIPSHGSCLHIPGYDFPRHVLKEKVAYEQYPLSGYPFDTNKWIHPLLYPVNNVLVFDEKATKDQLGNPKLVMVGGSSLSAQTLDAVQRLAEDGATVVIASWLIPQDASQKLKASGKLGAGEWIVTDSFLHDDVKEIAERHSGKDGCWMQRFGSTEVRMTAKDAQGYALEFDITQIK